SKDGKYLYAVEEIPIEESPKIRAFRINPEGSKDSLTFLNEQELPGSYSCHLAIADSHKYLIVAAYMSGNILVYPIDDNGALLPLSQNILHEGSGPNYIRQEAPHVHMIQPVNENGFYAVDLGLDTAVYYEFSKSKSKFISTTEFDLEIKKGAGARHMVFHPNSKYAFIFSELTSELFSFKKSGEKMEFIESILSLPNDSKTIPAGAAIRMHPNGEYLYVSNRGHNSISIFKFDLRMGIMILVDCIDSGGKTPRDFNIDPTGNWLLVANQDSDNLVVFKINQKNGLLKKQLQNYDVKTGCCIQFLK
ncbi:MAG: lactonase family protein, partial [Ignavibacteriae bacterium]|nr:lactonase family protein [Ignavibacteriota bacterium]